MQNVYPISQVFQQFTFILIELNLSREKSLFDDTEEDLGQIVSISKTLLPLLEHIQLSFLDHFYSDGFLIVLNVSLV